MIYLIYAKTVDSSGKMPPKEQILCHVSLLALRLQFELEFDVRFITSPRVAVHFSILYRAERGGATYTVFGRTYPV